MRRLLVWPEIRKNCTRPDDAVVIFERPSEIEREREVSKMKSASHIFRMRSGSSTCGFPEKSRWMHTLVTFPFCTLSLYLLYICSRVYEKKDNNFFLLRLSLDYKTRSDSPSISRIGFLAVNYSLLLLLFFCMMMAKILPKKQKCEQPLSFDKWIEITISAESDIDSVSLSAERLMLSRYI